MSYDYVYKIILAGSVGVGKTSIIRKITTNESFKPEQYCPTIGIEFISHILDIDGKQIKCRIWDTAGQERFRTISASFYKRADAIVLVYDTTDTSSFKEIDEFWMNETRIGMN